MPNAFQFFWVKRFKIQCFDEDTNYGFSIRRFLVDFNVDYRTFVVFVFWESFLECFGNYFNDFLDIPARQQFAVEFSPSVN